MTTGNNKEVILKLFEQAWNDRRFDVLPELLAPDYAERERNWAEQVLTAFPDTRFTIEDILAEGDRVAVRVTWHATHQGEFAGISPTGRQLALPAVFIYRMNDGKAMESWAFAGEISIYDQIKAAIAAD